MNEACTILEMKPGETATVTGFSESEGMYRRKLLSMGITRGVTITFLKTAPMGDPVEISLRGYSLSLRKAEAKILQLLKTT